MNDNSRNYSIELEDVERPTGRYLSARVFTNTHSIPYRSVVGAIRVSENPYRDSLRLLETIEAKWRLRYQEYLSPSITLSLAKVIGTYFITTMREGVTGYEN